MATADILKVKTFLLTYLPVYKFTDGATDSDLITSIYFDSPSRYLYQVGDDKCPLLARPAPRVQGAARAPATPASPQIASVGRGGRVCIQNTRIPPPRARVTCPLAGPAEEA